MLQLIQRYPALATSTIYEWLNTIFQQIYVVSGKPTNPGVSVLEVEPNDGSVQHLVLALAQAGGLTLCSNHLLLCDQSTDRETCLLFLRRVKHFSQTFCLANADLLDESTQFMLLQRIETMLDETISSCLLILGRSCRLSAGLFQKRQPTHTLQAAARNLKGLYTFAFPPCVVSKRVQRVARDYKWSCPICTFENCSGMAACEMCQSPQNSRVILEETMVDVGVTAERVRAVETPHSAGNGKTTYITSVRDQLGLSQADGTYVYLSLNGQLTPEALFQTLPEVHTPMDEMFASNT